MKVQIKKLIAATALMALMSGTAVAAGLGGVVSGHAKDGGWGAAISNISKSTNSGLATGDETTAGTHGPVSDPGLSGFAGNKGRKN